VIRRGVDRRDATDILARRSRHMLKLAGVLLVLMIVFGVLGFVVDVAGGLAKIAFFVCLVGLGVSLAAKAIRKT
jgi:uncharacterized membrane protein YtjA (UPF0391 family)